MFNGHSIDLASEALTMQEVAAQLQRVLHKNVIAHSVTPAAAIAAGLYPGWVRSQEWTNECGYRADIASLTAYGIPLTTFAVWIARHASSIVIGP